MSTTLTTSTMQNYQASMGYQGNAPPYEDLSSPLPPPTVIVRREIVVTTGPSALPILCDGCHRFVIPHEKHTVGGCAVVSAVGLCFVLPILAIVPLCCNTFKDILFVCPNCRTRINLVKKNRWL